MQTFVKAKVADNVWQRRAGEGSGGGFPLQHADLVCSVALRL